MAAIIYVKHDDTVTIKGFYCLDPALSTSSIYRLPKFMMLQDSWGPRESIHQNVQKSLLTIQLSKLKPGSHWWGFSSQMASSFNNTTIISKSRLDLPLPGWNVMDEPWATSWLWWPDSGTHPGPKLISKQVGPVFPGPQNFPLNHGGSDHHMPFTSPSTLCSVTPKRGSSTTTFENQDQWLCLEIHLPFSPIHKSYIHQELWNPSTFGSLFHAQQSVALYWLSFLCNIPRICWLQLKPTF